METIEFTDLDEASRVIERICVSTGDAGKGYCCVRNNVMEAGEFIQWITTQIGIPFSVSSQQTQKLPYDIVKDRGDRNFVSGGGLLSSSNQAFPLHTDCSFLEKPADLVILYCRHSAVEGGENWLVNISHLVPLLPAGYVQFLLHHKFDFYSKRYPVLEQAGPVYRVRYHEGEILGSCTADHANEVSAQLQQFKELLTARAEAVSIKLLANECLVINNRTCLHGRSGFEADSKREFYRARLYRPEGIVF